MEELLVDLLLCPICLDIPKSKVFQCRNGHTICSQCSTSLLDCPQCLVQFDRVKIRNRASESVLDFVKFDCANKENGCKKRLTMRDYTGHVQKCKYKLRTKIQPKQNQGSPTIPKTTAKDFSHSFINLCQALGHNCNLSGKIWSLSKTIKHLQKHHSVSIRRTRVGQLEAICYDNFLGMMKKTTSDSSFEAPLILKLSGEEKGPVFMICYTVTPGEDPSISGHCLLFNDAIYSASDYSITFSIESSSGKVPDLEWTMKTVGLVHANVIVNTSPFRIPASLLKQYMPQDGSLSIKFSLAKSSSGTSRMLKTKPKECLTQFTFQNSYPNCSFLRSRSSYPQSNFDPDQYNTEFLY